MCAPGDIIPAIIERNGPDDIVPDLIDSDSSYFVHNLTGASVVFNGVFGARHDAPGTDGRFQFRLRVPLPRLSTIWLLPENIVDAETGVAMMAPTTIFSEAVVDTGLFYREEDEDEEGGAGSGGLRPSPPEFQRLVEIRTGRAVIQVVEIRTLDMPRGNSCFRI